jgi:dihydroflavonol-4-reductase
MKAFVTGGTGFIGSHLIDYLLNDRKADVCALVRDKNKNKWLTGYKIQTLEGDLFSIPPLPDGIEYVFHVAGATKAIKTAGYYTVNQRGTASLLRALEAQKVSLKKLIFLSSQAVSGPSHQGRPVHENQTPAPISPYGKSKLEAEREGLQFKEVFPLVIIRAPTIFGPRDPVLLSYFKFIKKGILPSLGTKQRLVSLCYVKDLARAMVLSADRPTENGEIFHVADSTPRSWDELGLAAGTALGINLCKIKLPISILYPIYLFAEIFGKIRHDPSILSREKYLEMKQEGWVVDTKKAQDKLGFRPQHPFQAAIKQTLDWYIRQGWL